MVGPMTVDSDSILTITLDSCRYDTACAAVHPALDRVGPLLAATATASFTLPAHAALFAGVTPGVAGLGRPGVDPKAGKLFKLVNDRIVPGPGDWLRLQGGNIIEGFRTAGFPAVGTGAVDWFDTGTAPGRALTESFERFWFAGGAHVERQVSFLLKEVGRWRGPGFAFLNAAETHVPYTHTGAPWDSRWNPCVPFGRQNNAAECRRRQVACLEFVDTALAPLLEVFGGATVVVCADHGDAWGEDGLWEHGVYHPTVAAVPLWLRVGGRPVGLEGLAEWPPHRLGA